MSRPRLLRRLNGTSGDQLDDIRRLLGIRLGETPAQPGLGLPVLPPWLPDAEVRRRLQEAIAASLRLGEPRLSEIAVQDGGDPERPRFIIRARAGDRSLVDATVRPDVGGMEISA